MKKSIALKRTFRHRKEVRKLSNEQREKVIEALVDFVVRVAKSETATESEIAALPATVNALVNLESNC